MLTPATSAVVHSACCSARVPPCRAAKLLEHAVSCDTQGPCSPSTNDTRPTTTEQEEAVAAYTLLPASLLRSTAAYSHAHTPTYTPVKLPKRACLCSPLACSAS